MDARLIGPVIIIGVAAVVGALLYDVGGSGQHDMSTTSTIAGTPDVGQESGLDLSGVWSGTYNGVHGKGSWMWVIKKTGPNTYEGCLKTTGTYSTGDNWIPVSISVNGNDITIGATSGVVFSGRVSGSEASGTWKMAGGADTGSWSGSRQAGESSLPCIEDESTDGTTTAVLETSTTTTAIQGPASCVGSVPVEFQQALSLVEDSLAKSIGDATMTCVSATSVAGGSESVYRITGYSGSYEKLGRTLVAQLEAHGWESLVYQAVEDQVVIGAQLVDEHMLLEVRLIDQDNMYTVIVAMAGG